ncbi:MAG: SIS domain-containing protein, partial [Acetivibrio ethanolgignens]
KYTDSYMVLDAKEYGMDAIDPEVSDYFDPMLFYAMNCELRAARGRRFNHDVDYRRYMGVVEY